MDCSCSQCSVSRAMPELLSPVQSAAVRSAELVWLVEIVEVASDHDSVVDACYDHLVADFEIDYFVDCKVAFDLGTYCGSYCNCHAVDCHHRSSDLDDYSFDCGSVVVLDSRFDYSCYNYCLAGSSIAAD